MSHGPPTSIDLNVFYRQVSVRMVSSLDIGVALRRTVAYLQTLMPVKILTLAMFEPELNAVRLVAMASETAGRKVNITLPIPKQARPPLADMWSGDGGVEIMDFDNVRDRLMESIGEEMVCSHRPLLEELTKDLDYDLDPQDDRTSKMASLLKVAGQRVAMMVLASEHHAHFTEEHARLNQAMIEPCAVAVSNALKHAELEKMRDHLRDENRLLRKEILQLRGDDIVGADVGLREVMGLVQRVAPLDAPVLIRGETGAGKEVIATAVHNNSARAEGPFIKVNCGAIAESLVDSELFGHEKGAFTGATGRKLGRFERANTGTIFLDEIGELPPASQVRLLRVLQTKEIERVGGSNPIKLDIRVIAATHRDLEEMVREGSFRKDLWFRLDVFPIHVPPLRERRADIPGLVRHFLKKKAEEQRRVAPSLTPDSLEQLLLYDWPGNVRELANVVERALILFPEGPISFDWLAPTATPNEGRALISTAPEGPPGRLDETMAAHIVRALDFAGGKINGPGGAAELLGLHPNTLRNKMRKLGVRFGRSQRGVHQIRSHRLANTK